ncbi:CBO0543 family protein [Lentibacillus sp.]|uniref:CBO0543 family protein n=1 Tax=Lentibacillus sp. TaxID=1925746 RepID=UPI002B4ACD9D|nr:CBO0543 family protein [Lentibacillus sp.]HLS07674.1 CBO0543 family protein [Lentibacillus sp.]
MEVIVLWLFFFLGIILIFNTIRKPPVKDWLLCLLTAAYFTTFLGDIVVKAGLLSYPVKLFPQFQSSILYEYLLLPLMCIYFYKTTYHKTVFDWIWQALVYSSVLTVSELLLEQNTNLIHYINWSWFHTLASQFLLLLFIRWLLQLINKISER